MRKTQHIPGLAATIVKDQELVWSKGFGVSHFDTGDGEVFKKVTPDTPFWIASVTKIFLGLAFLQLEEEGFAALYLKIPERNLTLILLANGQGMWWGNPLDRAEVERSLFAKLFFDIFLADG